MAIKLTMHQCTLILLAKGQIVSFTFIAGSEDELDDLMDRLHFGAAKSPRINPQMKLTRRSSTRNHVPKSNKKRRLRSRFQPQNHCFLW